MLKNHLILVGDTQRTNPFAFWRERNDRERHLILSEIATRDPAFVLHLGDLTTRGASAKEWQEFDDLNKSVREKGIPFFRSSAITSSTATTRKHLVTILVVFLTWNRGDGTASPGRMWG